MKFAYADPPYLGCAHRYAKHHLEALVWNDPETHRQLILRLCAEYPDGWALSLHTQSLQAVLALCPIDVRIAAWCKPFVVFTNASPQYAWEPIIFRGGRKIKRSAQMTMPPLDWQMAKPPLSNGDRRGNGARPRPGFHGARPRAYCRFVFQLLNAVRGDTLDDLFPGTGAVAAAWAEWTGEHALLPALSFPGFSAMSDGRVG
jgi:hypothetical protein